MCLATAYKNAQDTEQVICDNITKITVDGNTVTLIDIIGEEIKVEGTIAMVDLTKSVVIINAAN